MTRRLVLTRRASAQINDLYEYIVREGSLEIADRYIAALLDRLSGLTRFPNRGTTSPKPIVEGDPWCRFHELAGGSY